MTYIMISTSGCDGQCDTGCSNVTVTG